MRVPGWITETSGPLPRPTRAGWVVDAVLAAAVGATGVQDAWDRGAPVALAVLAGGALAWRRRYPLGVLGIVVLALLLAPPEALRVEFYACVIAAYSAAAYSPYRVPALAGLVAAALVAMAAPDSSRPAVPNEYVTLLIIGPVILAANGRRAWRMRAAQAQRARAAEVRHAEDQERARLARELHDVVTHHVSMMVIQAGAARVSLAREPGQATEALLAVEASGRAALSDLRSVMGLLATGRDGIETLIEGVRKSGMQVSYRELGARRDLPDAVELAAYRVVQEALTNTAKHAAGATAAVELDYRADGLTVSVTDTGGVAAGFPGGGPGGVAGGLPGGGHGLAGLRVRVEATGGTLTCGAGDSGGYTVRACFPAPVAP